MPAARKYAAGDASRMSQARARHRPPPIAAPLTAAITGWCNRRSVRVMSSSISIERSAYVGRVSPSTWGGVPADSWSAPEQNPRAAPVTTRARTWLSWPRATSSSRKGTITSKAIAFMRSGRFRVTTATSGTGRLTRMKFIPETLGLTPSVAIDSYCLTRTTRLRRMFPALGRFVTRFPWYVIGAWVVVTVVVAMFAPKLTSTADNASFLPKHYESIRAADIKDAAFPGQGQPGAILVFSKTDG